MNKIKFFIALQPGKNPGRLLEVEPVPSNVGHRKIDGKTLDRPRDKSQAFDIRRLLAVVEKGLQSQADPQKRPVRPQVGQQRLNIFFFTQDTHHITESTHPGKNKLFGRQNILAPGDDFDGVTQTFDGINDASDIACAVVQ